MSVSARLRAWLAGDGARRLWRDPVAVHIAVVTVLFVGLVAAGITSSSMGLLSETGARDPSVLIGSPRPIRSDEYLRQSPTRLRMLEAGGVNGLTTPLAYAGSDAFLRSEWKLERIAYVTAPDLTVFQAATQRLPIANGFAALWWQQSWVVLVFIPLLLLLVGVRRGPAVAAAWLVWLSAPVAWWSLAPIAPIGTAALAGTLALAALRIVPDVRRASPARLATGAAMAFGAGCVAARLPFLYQPWALIVAPVIGAIIVTGALVSPASRHSRMSMLIVGFATAAAVAITTLVLQRERFAVLADTVYPGHRRSSGGASTLTLPWSGSTSWALQMPGAQHEMIALNQSEAAMGLSAAVVLVAVVVGLTYRGIAVRAWLPTAAAVVAIGVLLTWVVAPWPAVLRTGNPLVLVPSMREIQILGPLCMLVFAMSLSLAWDAWDRVHRGAVAVAAAFVLLLLLADADRFRLAVMPVYGPSHIWAGAAVATAALVLPLFWRRWLALLPVLLVSGLTVAFVNPYMRGPGALVDSRAAATVRAAAASAPGRWAADGMFADALLIASASPMLSGQQGIGPNEAAWRILDPSARYRDAWNRSSSYVTFTWSGDDVAVIDNPTPDVIHITVSPCSPTLRSLDLRWILSREPIDQPCVARAGDLEWQGSHDTLYRIA